MSVIRGASGRRLGMAIFGVATLAGLIALIVISPALMGSLGPSKDWRHLSEVGQAYGGISAVLSGLAFCGIACSLLLQWRQVRLAQEMMLRQRHFELTKLQLEDPSLGMRGHSKSHAEGRQWIIRNLWVGHWSMLWKAGSLDQTSLRAEFDDLFKDPVAVEWWTAWGPNWDPNPSRGTRKFLAVANSAYRDATRGCPGADDHATDRVAADSSAARAQSPLMPETAEQDSNAG